MFFSRKDPWEGFTIGLYSGATPPLDNVIVVSSNDLREAFAHIQQCLLRAEKKPLTFVVAVPTSVIPNLVDGLSRKEECRSFVAAILNWAKERNLRSRFAALYLLFERDDDELMKDFFDPIS